jgi:hypothetical protein
MKILKITLFTFLVIAPLFSFGQLFTHTKGTFERTAIKNERGENIWLENQGKIIYYETSKDFDGYVVYRKGDPTVQAKIGKSQVFYKDAGAPNWRVIYNGNFQNEDGADLMDLSTLNPITIYSQDLPTAYFLQKEKLDKVYSEYDSLIKLRSELKMRLKSYNLRNDYNQISTSKQIYNKMKNGQVYILINRSESSYYKALKKALKHLAKKNVIANFMFNDTMIIINSKKLGFKGYPDFESVIGVANKNVTGPNLRSFNLRFQGLKNLSDQQFTFKIMSILKRNDDQITIKDFTKAQLMKRVTKLDELYFQTEKQIEEVTRETRELEQKHSKALSGNYSFFGESSGAEGFGYLICNGSESKRLFLSGEWENGYPTEIFTAMVYPDVLSSPTLPTFEVSSSDRTKTLLINQDGFIWGGYISGEFNGIAIVLWKSGNYFRGELRGGQLTDGLYTYQNGERYIGQFDSQGLRSGYGIYSLTDGSGYEGQWKSGNRTGYGQKWETNGKISEGIWENNVLVKTKERLQQEKREEELRIAKKQEEEKLRKALEEQQAIEFWNLILQSAKESVNNSSTNKSSSASQGSSTQTGQAVSKSDCSTCKGTGNCNKCTASVKKPYIKPGPRCDRDDRSEVKYGYVLCAGCYGWGFKLISATKCDCTNGIGYCAGENCPYGSCIDGWVPCDKCNSGANGTNLGKCPSCKGTGKRN